MQDAPSGIILLTYKNKVLLMHKQDSVIDQVKHPWSLIKIFKHKRNSVEKALTECIYKEMGIIVENIEYLEGNYYHVMLTDKHVNNIKRSEHQLLDFFNINEVDKLFLTEDSAKFISNYKHLISL